MRISDWSSDVCSSDLPRQGRKSRPPQHKRTGMRARREKRREEDEIRASAGGFRHLPLVMHGPAVEQHLSAQPSVVAMPAIGAPGPRLRRRARSEEHTSELQSLMRISYAAFCLK